jgi:uncharacterized C2H2 Zn-finger protein
MQKQGDLLATIDGIEYRVGVLRVTPDGQQEVYCEREEWEQTDAAKVADRDQRIAALEEELARLRTPDVGSENGARACPQCGKVFKNERALRTHMHRAHGMHLDGTPLSQNEAAPQNGAAPQKRGKEPIPCPECGRLFKPGRVLALHRVNVHGLRGAGLGYPNEHQGREAETRGQPNDDTESE